MPGYIDSGAESLKITNCSLKSNITVTSVTANGADLYFALTPKVLKPGDSMQVKFKGNLPEVDKKRGGYHGHLSHKYRHSRLHPHPGLHDNER